MTISPETYTKVNNELVDVIDKYKQELTQYDMLLISVNLLVSYMEILIRFNQLDKQELVEEVIQLIKTSDYKSFISQN
jgi:hypothetical protein